MPAQPPSPRQPRTRNATIFFARTPPHQGAVRPPPLSVGLGWPSKGVPPACVQFARAVDVRQGLHTAAIQINAWRADSPLYVEPDVQHSLNFPVEFSPYIEFPLCSIPGPPLPSTLPMGPRGGRASSMIGPWTAVLGPVRAFSINRRPSSKLLNGQFLPLATGSCLASHLAALASLATSRSTACRRGTTTRRSPKWAA